VERTLDLADDEQRTGSWRALEWEDRACPLGCRRDDESVLRGPDRSYGVGGVFRVVRCRACRLLRTNPRPTAATIAGCYPAESYEPFLATARTPRGRGLGARLRRLLPDGDMAIVPRVAPGRVLEVGCASGAFLAKLRDRGWDPCGIEPSPFAAERALASGLDVYAGLAEDAPIFGRPFDLVVARHSLEHLREPLSVLRALRRQTRAGGWLACTVPDAGAFLLGRFGADWYDLDLPRHLFHYEPATLTHLLERSGWRVARVRGQATMNSLLGSRVLRRRSTRGTIEVSSPPRVRSAWTTLLEPVGWALGLMRQSGRMLIWARAE
jgi:SAM-dependent methyltransferase